MGLPAISLWFVLMYKTHSLPDFGCSCISMTDVKGFLGSPYRRGGEEMNGESFFYSWSCICKSAIKWNGVSFTRFFFFIKHWDSWFFYLETWPLTNARTGIHFNFHIMCNHKNNYWEKNTCRDFDLKKRWIKIQFLVFTVKICTLFTPINCIKKRLIVSTLYWMVLKTAWTLKSLSFFCVFSALHTSFDLTTFLFFP